MRDRHVDLTQATMQAVVAATWTALPDYLPGRLARTGVKAVLMTGAITTFVVLDQQRDSKDDDAGEPEVESETSIDLGTPRGKALLAAGGVVTTASSLLAAPAVSRRVVGWLEGRGVRRPWTVLGAAMGTASFVLDLAQGSTGPRVPGRR